MYLNYYNLKLMPFEIGPDPRFLWLGSKHKEVFAALRYSILESKGFIVVIGDPGTGKSTLLNATAANFGKNIRFAKITDPALNEMDFFNFVANAFDMGKTFKSKGEFLIELEKFIKDAGAQSKKVILVIDEAQRLTPDMLEQIRVFSNVETPGQKVVSCIFAGQTEFLDMVKHNRALMQRVFFSHVIQPLSQSETGEYIAHRLKIAGTEEPIFTSAAVHEIFRLTNGTPRLINTLCDQALIGGYFLKKRKIGPELIEESTENTLIPLNTPKEQDAEVQRQRPVKQSTSAQLATVNNPELFRNGPANKGSKALGRTTAFFATIALMVILGLAAYHYLNNGFRAFSIDFQTDLRQIQRNAQASDLTQGANEISILQGKLLEQRKQKDDAETHSKELQARLGTLEKDKQDLKTTIAEIQKKLESTEPAQDLLKGEVDTLKKENTRLQTQLFEIKNQKGAVESRLGDVEKQNIGLSADTKEIKSARDRVTQLEAAVSERDKKMTLLSQQFAELEKALTDEKTAKDKMGVELISQQTTTANLQKQYETARSTLFKLEADTKKTQLENTQLQAQLQEIKAQKPAQPPTPSRAAETSQSIPAVTNTATATPDPGGVIDFVIKRKSQ